MKMGKRVGGWQGRLARVEKWKKEKEKEGRQADRVGGRMRCNVGGWKVGGRMVQFEGRGTSFFLPSDQQSGRLARAWPDKTDHDLIGLAFR